MPFELGLTVALDKLHPGAHTWFVFESRARRIHKSLSDLGIDVYVHNGRPSGVFRELCNALVRSRRQSSVQQMDAIYLERKSSLPVIMSRAGAKSAFQARVFADLVFTAQGLAR